MVTQVPDPYDGNPMDLKVQYGTRSLGQLGYILEDSTTKQVVFQSDFKSDVITQAQTYKGFTPVDGSESTYARQLAGAAGEQPLTELMTVRGALAVAVANSLGDYLSGEQVEGTPLEQYEFQVSASGDTAIVVLVRHTSDTRWIYTFTCNVSGAITRSSDQ
jgi:hypothetical protein